MKKLKIYLSSGSVQTIPQMLDFARCAYDLSVVKIICWYRTELTPFQLKGTHAYYIRQKYTVSAEFTAKITEIIEKLKPAEVEIHGNIAFTNVELYRVVASISKKISNDRIKIHLYDDGIKSITDRYELSQLQEKEFGALKAACVKYFDAILTHETNPFSDYFRTTWPELMNYMWHHFFDVSYHLMNQYENHIHNGTSPFYRYIRKNTRTLERGGIHETDPKTLAFCLSLLNLNIPILNQIRQEMQHKNSLLYMGAGYFDTQKDNEITKKQVNKIIRMKDQGIIKDTDRVIFKAHPINHPKNRLKITHALGENVYTISNSLSFEILPLIGLAPKEIICTFSTLIFTMNKNVFRHIIGHADTKVESLKNPILKQLVKSAVIKKDIISGWLD
ncbi:MULTISPECIES: polysialyltransferase family glycosyltransferase [Enterobacterales]|uniref:polysialyltransferase family glycosyltransferase n=1 Tax=Enterobacterales TaxID=91347 RepID=UPI002ED87B1F